MDEMATLLNLQNEYDFKFDCFGAETSTIRIMADLEFPAVGMDGLTILCRTFYFEVHQKANGKAVTFFPSDSHVPKVVEALLKRGRRKRSGLVQPPGLRRVLGLELFGRSMIFPHPRASCTPVADQVRAVLEAAMADRRLKRPSQGEGEPALPGTRPRFQLVEPPIRKKFSIKNIEGEVREQPAPALNPDQYSVISSQRINVQTANKIVFAEAAWNEIDRHIGWGRKTHANVVEQGGVYIGNPFILPGGKRCGHVKSAIPAPDTSGTSTYVEFGHGTWAYFLNVIQERKASGEYLDDDVILGWYHTHPNSLDVFMSGTDLGTQRAQFYRPWNSAVVINPHRRLIAGFYGGAAEPAEVLRLEPRTPRTD